MRRLLAFMVGSIMLAALAACGGTVPAPDGTPTTPRPTSSSSDQPSSTASPDASSAPILPRGVPPSYAQDVPAGDVPLRALIPHGTVADGSWYATTAAGESILVAYARPGADPFRAERGFVLWRRFGDDPPWRAIFGVHHAADEGFVSTQALIADLTGDASDDALVNEITGGSGTCGSWRVIDLDTGREIWNRTMCDAQVVPSTDPVGIEITEAVFESGDAHCCPSSTRTTVLTYAGGGRWAVASEVVVPASS